MISYDIIWYDIIWYDMISYHIISHHMSWVRQRWRLRAEKEGKTFQEVLSLKTWYIFWKCINIKNPKKIRKKILYIFHIEWSQIDMFLFKLWDIPFFTFFGKSYHMIWYDIIWFDILISWYHESLSGPGTGPGTAGDGTAGDGPGTGRAGDGPGMGRGRATQGPITPGPFLKGNISPF